MNTIATLPQKTNRPKEGKILIFPPLRDTAEGRQLLRELQAAEVAARQVDYIPPWDRPVA